MFGLGCLDNFSVICELDRSVILSKPCFLFSVSLWLRAITSSIIVRRGSGQLAKNRKSSHFFQRRNSFLPPEMVLMAAVLLLTCFKIGYVGKNFVLFTVSWIAVGSS